jgi:penicillin-binding protein 1A
MFSRTARRRFKKLLLWVEIMFILVMGAGVGIVAGAFYQMSKILPPNHEIARYMPVAGTKFFSAEGIFLGSIADENREPVQLSKIPKRMQDAIIAIEDSRFYEHSGLDFRGLSRALWNNISSGNLTQQGGSTLTQQLARQIYLDPRKTMSRKMKETMLALQIERNWPKKQILETYLNQVYFGSKAYGIQAAAQTYFGKGVGELNLAECALLAGLPQRPSKLNPYDHAEQARGRRNIVLRRMAELGMIKPAEAEAAIKQPIRLAFKRPPPGTGFKRAPFFCNAVMEQLRDKYGDDLMHKGGFKVYTTINLKMQEAAERALIEGISSNRRAYKVNDGALVCLDPNTGFVRAMVGGVDFKKNEFNVVTQGRRQPGSSFKLFVYTAAIDNGWSPDQYIDASVRSHRAGDKWYTPQNSHRGSYGSVRMVNAFAQSINTAAVNTAVRIGPRTVKDYAQRLGIKSKLLAYPSIALGTSEVTPLEMANAYGVFAANGIRAEPQLVKMIKDRMGNIIEDNSPVLHRVAVKPETIQAMQSMTQAVVQYGTGWKAKVVPSAHGKTGTTENYTDAWFVGYTLQPALATAVWAGNLNNKPMRHGGYGGTICVPIWTRFMGEAVKLAPKSKLDTTLHIADNDLGARQRDERDDEARSQRERPRRRLARGEETQGDPATGLSAAEASPIAGNSGNMVRVRVCEETYELATRRCTHTRWLEYMSGTQPRRRCGLHPAASTRRRVRRRREPAPERETARATTGATPDAPPPSSASSETLATDGNGGGGDQ